jgi:hypothetical protein
MKFVKFPKTSITEVKVEKLLNWDALRDTNLVYHLLQSRTIQVPDPPKLAAGSELLASKSLSSGHFDSLYVQRQFKRHSS